MRTVAALLLVAACRPALPVEHARALHFDAIVVDGHNDVTTPILDSGFDLGMDGKGKTHTDLARMRRGGLDAEFFAIYVEADFVGKTPAQGGGAARRALDMIDAVVTQVKRHSDQMELATTADDVERIVRSGKIAALMGIEGGHAIEDSLGALRMFHRLGVRYMTLTHTNTNDWADSSGDADNPAVERHHGLTDFGQQVVREMNRLGMMVDVSHVSDETFWAVIRTSRAPVIASHSSARAIADHPRNLSDDMLRAVARSDGVVMVNFYEAFLDNDKVALAKAARAELNRLKAEGADEARVRGEMEAWMKSRRGARVTVGKLVDHIDHIVKVAGIDHVGLGSDFDGLPSLDSIPEGIDDVAGLPAIAEELVRRGYEDEDVRKILGGNLLRVMRAVENVASASP